MSAHRFIAKTKFIKNSYDSYLKKNCGPHPGFADSCRLSTIDFNHIHNVGREDKTGLCDGGGLHVCCSGLDVFLLQNILRTEKPATLTRRDIESAPNVYV